MIYIVESSNQTVVRNNYDIIEKAASLLDSIKILNDTNYLKEKYDKDAIIITGALSHAFRILLFKKRKVCVWVQGVIPEESFQRRCDVHAVIQCLEYLHQPAYQMQNLEHS